MCGRYTLTVKEPDDLAAALGAELEAGAGEGWKPRYNVAPTDSCLVLRVDEGGARRLGRASWGIMKGKGEKHSPLQINARSETAAKIPIFRDSFANRRCVVPSDGFYEWTGQAKARKPIWFHPAAGGLLLFAGVWDLRDGKPTFAILTTSANELIAPVHDRMPAVLVGDAVAAWLERPDPALLAPALVDYLVGTRVSPRVNAVANDDPGCLEPAPPDAEPPQLKLL
jgi:putative SOS response-associated peptidase YedK